MNDLIEPARPVCAICGRQHWFLEACASEACAQSIPQMGEVGTGPLASTASADEIERALKAYRRNREKARDRMRRKRAGHQG